MSVVVSVGELRFLEPFRQHFEQFAHRIRAAGIVNHLPIAARLIETEVAQLGQVLGQCRLAQ